MKLTERIRKWLAVKLWPEFELTEARLFRLRSDLSQDRHWLGYDFPEIDIFAFRALVMDANYARKIGELPTSMDAAAGHWSVDIAQFREQLRKFRSEGAGRQALKGGDE